MTPNTAVKFVRFAHWDAPTVARPLPYSLAPTMLTPSVAFPEPLMGEWVGMRTNSASGLFAHRQMQAIDLLELPDSGGGDVTFEQRREALQTAISFQKPLVALTIFLAVVALEDFVRDFGARPADHGLVSLYFPELTQCGERSG